MSNGERIHGDKCGEGVVLPCFEMPYHGTADSGCAMLPLRAVTVTDLGQVVGLGCITDILSSGAVSSQLSLPIILVLWWAAQNVLGRKENLRVIGVADPYRTLALAAAFLVGVPLLAQCAKPVMGWELDWAWLLPWGLISVCLSAVIQSTAAWMSRFDGGERTGLVVLAAEKRSPALAAELAKGSFGGWPIFASLCYDRAEDIARLRELAVKRRIRGVVLRLPGYAEDVIPTLRSELLDLPVPVIIAPDAGDRPALKSVDFELLSLLPATGTPRQLVAKRAFDLVSTLVLLLVMAPVLALAALAVQLETPGPVLFSQWRYGEGGQLFRIWKFRTMHTDRGDSTGECRTLARDPRVTRVGRILRRTSIDELPQLINVLRGEMSLVGPRPHTPHMKVCSVSYTEAVSNYRYRHRMKPGLTGWAQVNGSRGEVDTLQKARRRVDLDRWYIDNWSLRLDVWIVLRTMFGGFASPGAD
jgi:exopolysaccharide biosynthesis polyprenyl glycosylphosphotransferase